MSDTLLRPAADAGTSDAGPANPWDLPAPAGRRRRRPGRRTVAVAALGAVVAGGLLVAPPVDLVQAAAVSFDDGATHLTVEGFDERGLYSLRYVHGEDAEVRVPVRNDGWLPTTVTAIALDGRPAPMIEPVGTAGTPVELAPGEEATLVVRVRFDNCEYYTERAMDVYDEVAVSSRTAGVATSTQVALDHALVVRSPMMTTCPDRVSDRGAFLRGG